MTTYNGNTDTISKLNAGDIINFPYVGSQKNVTLEPGVYKIEVWGAQGGYRSSSAYGGKGGYSVGTLTLSESKGLWLRVGGSGNTGRTSGGYNGGGMRSTYPGGGGGTDVGIGAVQNQNRFIVAGGGGSDGKSSYAGGYGGGVTGQAPTYGYGSNYGAGAATYSGSAANTATTRPTGTSTQAYSKGGFWFGGNGILRSSGYGGAGGGGWYGGAGTYPNTSKDDDAGGSGGSGFVYTSETASQVPSGTELNSSMYLADAQTINGGTAFTSPTGTSETGHTGDGYCRITAISISMHDAKWVSDGVTVRVDRLKEGSALLTPPDVSKAGYTTSWTVNGQVVNLSTYRMPTNDITLVAVFTPNTYSILLYDNGNVSTMTAQTGSSVALPTGGTDTSRSYVGWYLNGQIITTLVMPPGDVTLLARYDESSARTEVTFVGVQPNPANASTSVLVSMTAKVTMSAVPRWSGVTITADNGLPMSSPFQAQIWDTTDSDPMATFEGDGIKTTGRDVPPLVAMDVPLPRIGIWSAGISGSDGSCDFTIHGTGTTAYTSSVIVYSSEEVWITEAEIKYTNGSTVVTKQATSSTRRLEFPSGTYKSFDIKVKKVSKPGCHVRVLNVAPGGA